MNMKKKEHGAAWTPAAGRVQEIRERQGLSITTLARMIGCDKSTLSRIESGESDLSVRKLLAIADALSIDPGVLIGGHTGLTDDESQLLRDYQSADVRGKLTISQVASLERGISLMHDA